MEDEYRNVKSRRVSFCGTTNTFPHGWCGWSVSSLLLLFLEIEEASLCRRRLQTAQFEKQSLLYKRKQYRDRVIFYATAIKSRAQKRGWKSEWHEMWQPAQTLKDSMTSSAVPQAFILKPVHLKEHKWLHGCGGTRALKGHSADFSLFIKGSTVQLVQAVV